MKSKFRFLSLLSRLGKDEHARRPRLLARLLRDEEGSFLVYVTLAIPVFLGFAAFASEGSLVFYNHRALQSATDAAAYSAAVAYSNGDTGSTALTTQAQAIVASYGFVVGTGNDQVNVAPPTVIPNYAGTTNTAIQVNTTRPQLPILSGLWLSNPINVGANAIAIVSGTGGGNCVLALGNNPKSGTNDLVDSIQVQGGGGAININLPTCGVYSNSTDCSKGTFSVSFGGNAKIVTGSLGASGCIDVFGASKVTLPNGGSYTSGNGTIINPYSGTTIPTTSSAGSCTPTAVMSSGTVTSSGTLCPGVYSNGIVVATGITVTLQTGVYILGGPFDVGPGGGTVTSAAGGVTLAFTSTSSGMNLSSLANVTLTAPTTGTTAGFVLMGDSTMPLGTSFTTWANATVSMSGLIYLPNGDLSWGGNPATGSNNCLEAIVNQLILSGDSAFSNSNCNSAYGGVLKPIGSVVTLVD
jgi:Flp pilus assembly protein TadG